MDRPSCHCPAPACETSRGPSKSMGETLIRIDSAIQWWIGDWLNAGERIYGEMYAQALDETGASDETLRQYKWVAGKIEMCTRVHNVSWAVHRAIAALPKEKHAEAIELAAIEKWTTRVAKSKVRQLQHGVVDPESLPKGKYRIIYADPP